MKKTALLTNEEKKARVRQRVRVQMAEGTYETFPETIRTDHYQSDIYQRVAIYARVSTDDVSQTTSFELQKKYVTLEFVSKLVILLSTLILGTVLCLISGVALLLLAFCLSSLIADFCGSQTVGYASVAGLCVLLVIIVYCNRKR